MIYEKLALQARSHPQKTALIIDEHFWNYGDLLSCVDALAEYLALNRIAEGSQVLCTLPNSFEFTILLLALAKLNAVIVPVNPTLKLDALKKIQEIAEFQYCVGLSHHLDDFSKMGFLSHQCLSMNENSEGVDTFEIALDQKGTTEGHSQVPKTSSQERPFILTMTSGSTGTPKPMIFSQELKIKRADITVDYYQLKEDIITLVATPQYHSLAQRLTLMPLMLGGTVVLLKHYRPELLLKAIETHKINFMILVSSQLTGLLKSAVSEYDLSSLKTIVSSSALILADQKEALKKAFDCDIHEIYGASEVATVTDLSAADTNKVGSVGKPFPGVKIKIADEHGQELPVGETGEILVKSPTVFQGYYQHEALTKNAFKDDYFRTGDLGCIDAEGYLTFLGRQKDIIITGGINVYPKDIEQVLMASELLLDVCVIGIPDEYFGEAILAVVVPRDQNLNIRALQKTCFQHLADFQQPLGFEIVEQIPLNAMGKVDRNDLRKKFGYLNLSQRIQHILGS